MVGCEMVLPHGWSRSAIGSDNVGIDSSYGNAKLPSE